MVVGSALVGLDQPVSLGLPGPVLRQDYEVRPGPDKGRARASQVKPGSAMTTIHGNKPGLVRARIKNKRVSGHGTCYGHCQD